ncbi:MAG: FAD-dependent monooxygenase [Syntrophales bacterium]|jgi:uncharacterized FAD-dependent dehydrogenase|nr:FAD-dependent monooxygenase [Syntrophales bacterium]
MGYREITCRMPAGYNEGELRQTVARKLGIRQFTFQIESKSLDSRKKNDIHWLLRLSVCSDELAGGEPPSRPSLAIPFLKNGRKVMVIGSGPAGFFAAFVLQNAGFSTIIVERGAEVRKRARGIKDFEQGGPFNPRCNYAFGEGGAGTFSDGKLTSRSKHITEEKAFIIDNYIRAGAPEEIRYMAHPHLGSDNLKSIVGNLRRDFLEKGGQILFETVLEDLKIEKGKIIDAVTSSGIYRADFVIVAPGHSAYDTYRMLMKRGVLFRTKNFAIGSRVEHPQELINRAQWGRAELPGVKAAEYRLTSKGDGNLPVYTFCMCPGGVVVPATAFGHTNIVNGMSRYRRDGPFANAACVAAVNIAMLRGKETKPADALQWLEDLEGKFFLYPGGFQAPCCSIENFIEKREPAGIVKTSYPLGLTPAPLWEMLPPSVSAALREGLRQFVRKIRGFEKGSIMGLESKTSSPVQAVREAGGLCSNFENLYLVGEGSGWTGGILSSAADGIRAALRIIGSVQ